jgi:4-hydroxybenzoate polyprenyltransferase
MGVIITFFSAIYRFIRLLSIDVALGSVVLTNSLSMVFDVDMPMSISVSLFIAVWLIYSFDHLMDAKRLSDEASMSRHRFHQKYRKVIIALMFFGGIVGVLTLPFLPAITALFGAVVVFIVLIYFLLSWKLKVLLIKEVFIASVYTTGVFLGPVSLGATDLQVLFYLFMQVFFLALLNLLILSYYEISHDRKDGQHSWAVKFGEQTTRVHMNVIFAVLAVLQISSLVFLEVEYMMLQSLLIGMSAILYLVFRKSNFFREQERYRSCCDLIFFVPGLMVWL